MSFARSRSTVSTVAVSVALLLFLSVEAMDTPPLLTAMGSYYDVGYSVGWAASSLIRRRFEISNATWDFLVNSNAALQLNQTMYTATVAAYPELLDELQGIADGSSMSFAQIFFLNTMTELESLQAELAPQAPHQWIGQCTDVFAAGVIPETSVWGHNEDSGAHDCNLTYLVNATIIMGDQVVEQFVAYTYPASVAGRAFGWNAHGLIITTNALFSNNAAFDVPTALPRAIHNRAMYRARSVDEAITFAIGMPSIVSFSLNVGTWVLPTSTSSYKATAQYYNVEVNTNGGHSVTPIYPRKPLPDWLPSTVPRSSRHHFYHANNFEVLFSDSVNDTSSTARINRLNEYPVPTTDHDVRKMLGDTKNATWPVWQHNSAGLYTMATAVFHFDSGIVAIYVDNPSLSEAVYELPSWYSN